MIEEVLQLEKRYRTSILYLALIFMVPEFIFSYIQFTMNGEIPFFFSLASIAGSFWGGFFAFSVYRLIIDDTGKNTVKKTLNDARLVLRYYLTLFVHSLVFIAVLIVIQVIFAIASVDASGAYTVALVSASLGWLWISYLYYVFLLLPATYAATDCDRRRGARAVSRIMVDKIRQVFPPYAYMVLAPSFLVILISLIAPESGGGFAVRTVLIVIQRIMLALLMVRGWREYGGQVELLLAETPGPGAEPEE